MSNLDTLPLPLLKKIAEYSRSKYDFYIAIIFNDREGESPRNIITWDSGYVNVNIRADFIIDFPNEKVRNWFNGRKRDMISESIDPPRLHLDGIIKEGTLTKKDISIRYSRQLWIQEYNIPNNPIKFKIPLFFRAEASDNVLRELDYIKGKIRDYMIQQSLNIMKFLFAKSDAKAVDANNMVSSYKLFDNTALSERAWKEKLQTQGRIFTSTFRWTFQIVNNTKKKITNNENDDTYVVNLKL